MVVPWPRDIQKVPFLCLNMLPASENIITLWCWWLVHLHNSCPALRCPHYRGSTVNVKPCGRLMATGPAPAPALLCYSCLTHPACSQTAYHVCMFTSTLHVIPKSFPGDQSEYSTQNRKSTIGSSLCKEMLKIISFDLLCPLASFKCITAGKNVSALFM